VDAERDGVKVPTTLAEYCVKTKTPAPDEGSDLLYDDYYEDDEMEEEADSCYGDEDDSGNEESWWPSGIAKLAINYWILPQLGQTHLHLGSVSPEINST